MDTENVVMIQDKTELGRFRKEWTSVRKFQAKIHRHLNMSGAGGIGTMGSTHELRNISHNLTLLFAFSVLEKVLKQMKDEGQFSARKDNLGTLMHSSKEMIPWSNFALVDQAREDRNKITHEQETFERSRCWNYIDAIEAELVLWNILSAPIPFKH